MGAVDMATLEVKVEQGIKTLNEHGPAEWWDRIEVNRLFLASRSMCVLGQVFGGYEEGLDDLGLMNEYESEMCGFSAPYDQYMDLTHAWREAVTKIQTEVRQ